MSLSLEELERLESFGANLRRERCAKGWTQSKLADRAGISTRNLQKAEAGEFNTLLTTISRFQDALGCSWKKLMAHKTSK